jgi:hypothetical protein
LQGTLLIKIGVRSPYREARKAALQRRRDSERARDLLDTLLQKGVKNRKLSSVRWGLEFRDSGDSRRLKLLFFWCIFSVFAGSMHGLNNA